MSNNVLHIIRKSSQLRATFINNQIINHIRYNPFIVFKEFSSKLYDGGYSDFDFNKYKILQLNEKGKKSFAYKYLKRISDSEIEKILNFIKENRIKILHFHYGTDAGLYYKLMKQSGLPSVISFYGYESSSFPGMFMGYGKYFLNKRVFPYATKIFAMSKEMKKDCIELGCDENKIIVHYHGVNGDIYYYPEREYCEKNKMILLNVSSLVEPKGHIFLFKAIKELVNRNIRNFELRLIGTGDIEIMLKNFVKENKLSEYITFVGVLKAHSDDILSEYKNADIFVHPSVIPKNGDKEGIPGTIVEAMFSGLPVISTYIGGIPYIIENEKTGLLNKEWDVEKLAENILKLMNSVKLREQIGRSGQIYAKENLDLKIKEANLENIYDDLIESFKNNKNIVS